MPDQKLVIMRKNEGIVSALFEDNDMVKVNLEPADRGILGNIYVGRVKNVVKNIQGAFVEIEGGRMCYFSLKECVSPILVTSKRKAGIAAGDQLLVQVYREPIKTKAPYAVTNLSLTGKYVVLSHGKLGIGISGKITDAGERQRLRELLSPYESGTYGFVARTNAEKAGAEQIEHEVRVLQALYENLCSFGVHKSVFSCVYHAPFGYLCDIRDGYSKGLGEILTDDKEIYENIRDYLNCYQPEDLEKLRWYQDSLQSLEKLYSVDTKLNRALQRQVWLPCGGTLVIEPTEALTVIDVNTGKAIRGKKKVQETFFKVNMEAAAEAAKQIRLRNLSGIILIDFIDMESEDAKERLLSYLRDLVRQDPVKTVLVDMTPLGLVEITRKKTRKPLYEQVRELGR